MRYSWDSKNRRNLKLPGDRIRRRSADFRGPTVELVDDRFDYGEQRVYAIGLANDLDITVIYADRNRDERRIISAGRAVRRARKW